MLKLFDTLSQLFVEYAQAHYNCTTYKMAAGEDAPEFSEDLHENGTKCQSKNKNRKADSGKGGKVLKSKRWRQWSSMLFRFHLAILTLLELPHIYVLIPL